jgi:hypothetical protein
LPRNRTNGAEFHNRRGLTAFLPLVRRRERFDMM